MSKAILVINMPKNCYECDLNNYHFCDATGDCIVKFMNSEHRPDWCPLKAMPEKYNNMACDGSSFYHMCVGWNNCIDEINNCIKGETK